MVCDGETDRLAPVGFFVGINGFSVKATLFAACHIEKAAGNVNGKQRSDTRCVQLFNRGLRFKHGGVVYQPGQRTEIAIAAGNQGNSLFY
ncbi:hypothetical protein C7M51_00647 [Mixta intestinalis]|uniref:Uncharacterized protein n=1 Tax=Mixta intestinalis TaxID=1615494 RepID=A0A6P1PWF2_9GAMM|nr:hypothetical protein C7M51_00647 [Mixta intestinalis]